LLDGGGQTFYHKRPVRNWPIARNQSSMPRRVAEGQKHGLIRWDIWRLGGDQTDCRGTTLLLRPSIPKISLDFRYMPQGFFANDRAINRWRLIWVS